MASTPTAGDGGGASAPVTPTAWSGDPVTATGTDGTSTETAVPVAEKSASNTVVKLGAGKGKRTRTSGVWQHFEMFEPADSQGRNVRCTIATRLPASGLLPERMCVCGQRFKYRGGNRQQGVHGSGTSGLLGHLRSEHPEVMGSVEEGRGSKSAKEEKGTILLQAASSTSSRGKNSKPAEGMRLLKEHYSFKCMTPAEREKHHTRYVIMCCVDMERLTLTTKAFPGTHTAEDIEPWVREVTTEFFAPIVGDTNAAPEKIYVAATVDQGGNMVNAFRALRVPVLICTGHRLNSSINWGLGISGSWDKTKATGTCKNLVLRELVAVMTALAGVFSLSPCNNDAFEDMQTELDDMWRALEVLRRNDTRWGSVFAMMKRELRLYAPLQVFFSRNLANRTIIKRQPTPAQWQATREVVSVLADASLVSTQIQGGPHGFVGKSINSLYVLLSSLALDTQDILRLDPFDGTAEETPVSQLLGEVQDLLKILKEKELGDCLGADGEDMPAARSPYRGYSFTGCGAHVDYRFDLFSGGGYERVWCYVTSPPDCPGESPYIPEGLKTDNTLPEWVRRGAAWKECYDGYRCEAWWGSLEGTPSGEPVVLDAPLDWPDCCALCSNNDGGVDDGTDDEQPNATSACVGWSFDPSTGSCQQMSGVESVSRDSSWGTNSTVHGYAGYFEAPLGDCWGRDLSNDLCVNTSAIFVIIGVIMGFCGLLCVYTCIRSEWEKTALLRELLANPESSRLVKAACVQVTGQRFLQSSGKGGRKYSYRFEGTFITQDGALYMVPPASRRRRPTFPTPGHNIENWMLRVLFQTDLNPLRRLEITPRNPSTPVAIGYPMRAQGPPPPMGDLRSEYSRLTDLVGGRPLLCDGRVTRRSPEQGADRFRFDCLLLMGEAAYMEPGRKVLLVGVLGEDRITCVNEELGLPQPLEHFKAVVLLRRLGFFLLFVATVLLVLMCVSILTTKAAQNMAAWTFHGNNKAGAIVGLVICASVPVPLFTWTRYRNRELQRLVEGFPPVDPELDRARL
eukprot:g19162.t1